MYLVLQQGIVGTNVRKQELDRVYITSTGDLNTNPQ